MAFYLHHSHTQDIWETGREWPNDHQFFVCMLNLLHNSKLHPIRRSIEDILIPLGILYFIAFHPSVTCILTKVKQLIDIQLLYLKDDVLSEGASNCFSKTVFSLIIHCRKNYCSLHPEKTTIKPTESVSERRKDTFSVLRDRTIKVK